MKYALNLSEDGRILSVTYEKYAGEGQPIVETLPEGDCYDYRYVDGEYLYEPLAELEDPNPEPTMKERVESLEEALEMILLGVTE